MTMTEFPLGYFVGAPDGVNAAAETTFQAETQEFEQTLGSQPQFIDSFIDITLPESEWLHSAQFQAYSTAQSPVSQSMTPIIALPMGSSAAGSPSADQMFQNFASGSYDDMLYGMVKTWADQGFATQYWRPGWEMDLASVANYAGSDPGTQADYIAAFQHIYTVLHAAGAADGVQVEVMGGPRVINYTPVGDATQTVYPGSNYVDVIGADVYSDVDPYGSPDNIYDYSSGQIDASVSQWAANPANLFQYFEYPAQTQYSLDGSLGHSLSLQKLLDFAKLQGKSFAVAETGAGSINDGAGVSDDPYFVQWLATTLAASGVPIDFVNIWDSTGGGPYKFSSATNNKPLEAAAWARFFGAEVPALTTVGSGSNTIALTVSEDAWLGNAQFTISIDGTQVGGVQTSVAQRFSRESQVFDVKANLAAGAHVVTVDFVNDASFGTSDTDRNLYVQGATLDGKTVANSALSLGGDGPQSFEVTSPSTNTFDQLDVMISEDAWQGDAQFTISIDGQTIGGVRTATAYHAAGQTQNVPITGKWGFGAHTVNIAFINDAYGGSPETDRNLYIEGISYDGQVVTNNPTELAGQSTDAFAVPATSASHPIVLQLSEDAYLGDAQYAVSIDGGPISSTGTVTALSSQDQTQNVALASVLSKGTHDLALSFLNDAYGGSPLLDRNLYLNSLVVNGTTVVGAYAELAGCETDHFQFVVSGR